MKKTLLSLALIAGLTSFAGNAKAGQTFNWSFTGNVDYPSGGYYLDTIGGTLTLNDEGTAATSVVVTSEIGGNVPFNSYDFATGGVIYNTFSVDGSGAITSADFYGYKTATLAFKSYGVWYNNEGKESYNTGGFAGIAFTPATVPEPSTYALFGIGAIGMLMVLRRKKTA